MSPLVGTWELVEWTAQVGSRVQRPFGGDVVGLLTYTPEGRMWATLMRRDREPVGASTLAGATASQRAAAAAGYLNYAGTYEHSDDRVVHNVEVALMPNWVGAEQVRRVAWFDDELELSTDPEPGRSGTEIVNRLRWRRLGG